MLRALRFCHLPVATGLLVFTHVFQPPTSARTFLTPRSLSMSAARALVNSSRQAQYATTGCFDAMSCLTTLSYSSGHVMRPSSRLSIPTRIFLAPAHGN